MGQMPCHTFPVLSIKASVRLSKTAAPNPLVTGREAKQNSPRMFVMSTTRAMPGGWVNRRSLSKGPNGRNLCRWCNLEVPVGRITFCSAWCVNEWKLRTDPSYLRDRVFERDHGICAQCGIECCAEFLRLKRLRGRARLTAWTQWSLKPGQRNSLWDADHIVPVVEGGGECDLENIRTLCIRCHREATADLRRRRSSKAEKSAM
jgi:5-methylcytosine-specific restriction enzyme A